MKHAQTVTLLTSTLLGGGLLALMPPTGCGGKAVIDEGNATTTSTTSSGTSTTSSGTSTTSSGTTTPTDPCKALEKAFDAAYQAAVSCNPAIDVIQCSGQLVIMNKCGCPVVSNDGKPGEYSQALAAYDAWVNAGCGPYDCANCPPPPSSGWHCDPVSAECEPPNQ